VSTRTETTTSNSNTQSVEPWGPMQAPLEKNINMLNNLSGDKQWFRKANPGQFQQAFNMYDYAANMNNRGQDYFIRSSRCLRCCRARKAMFRRAVEL